MNKNYLKNSLTFRFFAQTARIYSGIRYKVLFWYQNSQIYKKSNQFSEFLLICLKGSFLGRISEIRPENNHNITGNSKAVQYSVWFYNKIEKQAASYLRVSKTYTVLAGLRQEFNCKPVKTLGVIIFMATLVNVILSLLFNREILFMGWLIRGLLIFVSLGSLCYPVGWKDVCKTSFVVRCINNCCKYKT